MLHNILRQNVVNCVLKRRLTAVGSRNKSHIWSAKRLTEKGKAISKVVIFDILNTHGWISYTQTAFDKKPCLEQGCHKKLQTKFPPKIPKH